MRTRHPGVPITPLATDTRRHAHPNTHLELRVRLHQVVAGAQAVAWRLDKQRLDERLQKTAEVSTDVSKS